MIPESEPRVLLVDSRAHNYALLEGIADTLGIVVDHAPSTRDALELSLRSSYEILVIDAETVVPQGTSLVPQLLTFQPFAGLLVTGDMHSLPPEWMLEGSLLGSLRKPWESDQVQSLLRCALDFSHERKNGSSTGGLPSGARLNILLVSSDEASGPLPRLLQEAGVRVTHASCLAQGEAKASQRSFDGIVAELSLSDACGLDSLIVLRAICPKVPIVAVAQANDPAMIALAFQMGAQDVLFSSTIESSGLVRTLEHAVQRQRALADINHRALHDELTSLAKRTLLHQRISNSLARCRRMGNTFAVIYLDLDRFKWVNDTHGHDVGDTVLVTVAERLLSAVREYDTVARMGGDEFAILLDTLEDPSEAERVAQRVLVSVSRPIVVRGLELEMTASMGVSVFPRSGSGVEDLLKNADQAMYCAKRSGRNTYSLTPFAGEAPGQRRTSIRAPLMRCP